MHKLGVMIPMKVGICNDLLAVTDPGYQYALMSDGAMRCKRTRLEG